MAKFKIGDVVKLINDQSCSSNKIGDIGNIIDIDNDIYKVEVTTNKWNNRNWSYEVDLELYEEPKEVINHPKHYNGDSLYETIKVIDAWQLNFNLGNCIKYISRADKKDSIIQDLKKAKWYLEREITKLENADKNN